MDASTPEKQQPEAKQQVQPTDYFGASTHSSSPGATLRKSASQTNMNSCSVMTNPMRAMADVFRPMFSIDKERQGRLRTSRHAAEMGFPDDWEYVETVFPASEDPYQMLVEPVVNGSDPPLEQRFVTPGSHHESRNPTTPASVEMDRGTGGGVLWAQLQMGTVVGW